jgi:hypothetical protein
MIHHQLQYAINGARIKSRIDEQLECYKIKYATGLTSYETVNIDSFIELLVKKVFLILICSVVVNYSW